MLYAHGARRICTAQIAICLVYKEQYIRKGSKAARRVSCACHIWINSVLIFKPIICLSMPSNKTFGVHGLLSPKISKQKSMSLTVQPDCLKGLVVCGTVYENMHFKILLGSIARVGYCIPVPDFYLVLHVHCRKSTKPLMDLSINH